MKTDDLITALSTDCKSNKFASPTITMLSAIGVSCLAVLLLAVGWLGLDANPISAFSERGHEFLLNMVFILCVGSIATAIIRDLSVPGRSPRLPFIIIVAPFILLGCLAAYELRALSLHNLFPHLSHASILTCIWQTLVLAVPPFSILAIGMRRLAPTDLRRSGFYVGLLAGAIGAMGYCLHAPSNTFVFGSIIYPVSIATVALVGGLIGPRLLRWR